MKTSTLAMPAAVVDPIYEYRRGLLPALSAQLEITPLEADQRTPEIAAELERLEQSLQKRKTQIQAEQTALGVMEADYQRLLLSDRQAAVKLKSSILTATDAITQLSARSDVDKDAMKRFEAEKAEIAQDRERRLESNRIASEINNRKQRAKEIMDRIIAELPELRDECYRPLRERSQDQRLPEVERARLAKAADQIQGVWREYIHRQLDGSERTGCWDFLDHWTNLPTIS